MLICADVAMQVEGLITLTDIVGEKPIQVTQSRGISNAELLVRDIMTPQARLEGFGFDEVSRARVGHVVESLKRAGRQHALVLEVDAQRRQLVRGVFSTTQIARQLGVQIQTSELAHTFAEIEAMLAR